MQQNGSEILIKDNYPFWFGGIASCIATCITHPLDLAKVRMQTSKEKSIGLTSTLVNILHREGFKAVYNGLTASVLRQATYSTVRFGIYQELKDTITEKTGHSPSFKTLICIATISGVLGGIVSNPADIINVRMQNDNALPHKERRNYKNAFHGLYVMSRNEGFSSFYRGILPNIIRAALVTTSQLSSYDQFKEILKKSSYFSEGILRDFTSAVLAGFVATTVCSPMDVMKSRIMNSNKCKNMLLTFKEEIKKEGIRFIFRGWTPSFIRLGPHTTITFIIFEEEKKLWRRIYRKDNQNYKN